MRKILIVFQFTVAVLIITVTYMFFSQLRFFENKRLGFDKDNVVVINDMANDLHKNYDAFKNSLMESPYIKSVTSGDIPGKNGSFKYSFYRNGKRFSVRIIDADLNYIKTLGLQLKKGRTFRTIPNGANILINEACAEGLNTNKVIGLVLGKELPKPVGKIIGVLKNFNMKSLREPVNPIAIRIRPGEHGGLMIRIQPYSIKKALSKIKKEWNIFVRDRPLQYSFLNNDLKNLYTSDERLAKLFGIFALVAIFVASIGLFGITSLATEQRIKEIGIRKVLGASIMNIVTLISKEFIILVFISNVIAAPISYFALKQWLGGFACRINPGATIFITVAVFSILISVLTISFRTLKAATENPVKSLRYE